MTVVEEAFAVASQREHQARRGSGEYHRLARTAQNRSGDSQLAGETSGRTEADFERAEEK